MPQGGNHRQVYRHFDVWPAVDAVVQSQQHKQDANGQTQSQYRAQYVNQGGFGTHGNGVGRSPVDDPRRRQVAGLGDAYLCLFLAQEGVDFLVELEFAFQADVVSLRFGQLGQFALGILVALRDFFQPNFDAVAFFVDGLHQLFGEVGQLRLHLLQGRVAAGEVAHFRPLYLEGGVLLDHVIQGGVGNAHGGGGHVPGLLGAQAVHEVVQVLHLALQAGQVLLVLGQFRQNALPLRRNIEYLVGGPEALPNALGILQRILHAAQFVANELQRAVGGIVLQFQGVPQVLLHVGVQEFLIQFRCLALVRDVEGGGLLGIGFDGEVFQQLFGRLDGVDDFRHHFGISFGNNAPGNKAHAVAGAFVPAIQHVGTGRQSFRLTFQLFPLGVFARCIQEGYSGILHFNLCLVLAAQHQLRVPSYKLHVVGVQFYLNRRICQLRTGPNPPHASVQHPAGPAPNSAQSVGLGFQNHFLVFQFGFGRRQSRVGKETG